MFIYIFNYLLFYVYLLYNIYYYYLFVFNNS